MRSFLRLRPLLPFAILFVCATSLSFGSNAEPSSKHLNSTPLRQGWAIQSACKIQSDGAQLSSPQYRTQGWIAATVPTTVLAAQVAAGIYPDPYFGMNLRKIPGTAYPIGAKFSTMPMPTDSPYRCGWWYRKQFQVPTSARGKTVWLHFAGINYRADLWVNGHQIANSKQIAGAYRTYDFDISRSVTAGQSAAIAVEVFAPGPTDLGINWVDWNPTPADKDMGLWGEVSLITTGPVSVRSPFITTHFEDSSLGVADITATAQLKNATDHPIDGIAAGTFAGVKFQQPVHLDPGKSATVNFSPDKYPQLKLRHPRIWWPAEMGTHPLETLTISFINNGRVSDTASARVGIREAASELTASGVRLFRINRKPILIRGGGWSQDLMLRQDREQLPQQIRMVKDMHLNAIRLEGKLEGDAFFRLTDENGILVMAGWCCCDQWEFWDKWTPENYQVAADSLRSQMLRLRHHASIFVWLNGSDRHPPANVEQAYLHIEREAQWPNATQSHAYSLPSTVSGPSGVKMTGPYDYVSPSYWLVDKKYGGAHGFNTETSPGPAIPQPDSLRRFLPAKDLWPINNVWNYHAGGGDFVNLHAFNDGMRATYGWPNSMEDYSRIAQTMAYDGERAMFEAYARNKYASTGVIQWMMNNAWPSVIWHLYDYYLQTGGGYFGTKEACEPLHIQYSYDDHTVYAVSSLPVASPSLTAHAEVFDFQLRRVFDQTRTVDVAPDGSQKALDIPASIFQPADSLHFVRLELKDKSGKVISRNFYWIPSTLTNFDWAKTDYTHTPAKTFANMQILRTLPKSQIRATMTRSQRELSVHLENPSSALAFQVQLAATTPDGKPIVPVLWSDDFIELMPGETRDLTAEIPENYGKTAPTVTVTAWNTNPVTLRIKTAH